MKGYAVMRRGDYWIEQAFERYPSPRATAADHSPAG